MLKTKWGCLTLAGPIVGPPTPSAGRGGGGLVRPLFAVSPLMELEPRGKNKRVRRFKAERLIPDFKVPGQPVTSEVKSKSPR